jgi:hypothetical protein
MWYLGNAPGRFFLGEGRRRRPAPGSTPAAWIIALGTNTKEHS